LQESETASQFGVCFVDAACGEVCLSFIDDDVQLSKLRTLLVQLKPREVVYRKGGLRRETALLIKHSLIAPIINILKQEEWIDSKKLLDKLTYEEYFFNPKEVSSSNGSYFSPSELLAQFMTPNY
jgi:DNA mismatch repair protein MSH6